MQTESLRKALKLAAPALQTAEFIEHLTHFKFNDETLAGYDGRTMISVAFETGLECSVRGAVLLNMLAAAAAEVELEVKEDTLHIEDGKAKLKLPTISVEEDEAIAAMLDVEPKVEIAIGDAIIESLERAIEGTNQDAFRPEFTGVTTLITDQKHVKFYATDETSITKCEADAAVVAAKKMGRGAKAEKPAAGNGKTQHLVISRQSADVIVKTYRAMQAMDTPLSACKLMASDDVVRVEYTGEFDVVLVAKTIEGDPIDFEGNIKGASKGEYIAVPKGLDVSLSRAIVLQGKEVQKRCALDAKGKALAVWTRGMYGQMDDKLDLAKAPDDAWSHEVAPEVVQRCLGNSKEITFREGMLVMRDHNEEKRRTVTYFVSPYGDTKLTK